MAAPGWLVSSEDYEPEGYKATLEEFREKNAMNLAIDAAGALVYLAPSRVNLQLAQERAPGVQFLATREHAHSVGVD